MTGTASWAFRRSSIPPVRSQRIHLPAVPSRSDKAGQDRRHISRDARTAHRTSLQRAPVHRSHPRVRNRPCGSRAAQSALAQQVAQNRDLAMAGKRLKEVSGAGLSRPQFDLVVQHHGDSSAGLHRRNCLPCRRASAFAAFAGRVALWSAQAKLVIDVGLCLAQIDCVWCYCEMIQSRAGKGHTRQLVGRPPTTSSAIRRAALPSP